MLSLALLAVGLAICFMLALVMLDIRDLRGAVEDLADQLAVNEKPYESIQLFNDPVKWTPQEMVTTTTVTSSTPSDTVTFTKDGTCTITPAKKAVKAPAKTKKTNKTKAAGK